ncbi:MAG: hypothetical protein IKD72_07185 [Clostridia bacterium]|nr:hypothetical protein [Clostridia bacterium]
MTRITLLLIGCACVLAVIFCIICALQDFIKYKDWTSGILMLIFALLISIVGANYLEVFFWTV